MSVGKTFSLNFENNKIILLFSNGYDLL